VDSKSNPFIDFYGKHKISPVRQDISDFKKHLKRREKLYRTLGIPIIAFSNNDVLEVGPGGGYNTLCFFNWGANVDLVEPNPAGYEEMVELFSKNKIDPKSWNLFKSMIEDYNTDKLYDVVVAEGFLPGIKSRYQILSKISSLVKKGGVVVVTCVDDISYFFEYLRRLLAIRLIEIKNVKVFQEKVELLSKAFHTHLNSLKHSSRFIGDWVEDVLLNPAAVYGDFFSIADCIKEFDNNFEFLGSSPNMFTDYSWYKDVDFRLKDEIIDQFNRKRHLLLSLNLKESINCIDKNMKLFELCKKVRLTVNDNNELLNKRVVLIIIDILEEIKILTKDLDSKITIALDEIKELLSDDNLSKEKIANSSKITSIFGRGMQYVSMVKKFEG